MLGSASCAAVSNVQWRPLSYARALKVCLHLAAAPSSAKPLQQIKEKVCIYGVRFYEFHMSFKSLICEHEMLSAIAKHITCSDTVSACALFRSVHRTQNKRDGLPNSFALKYATLKMLMMIHRTHGPRGFGIIATRMLAPLIKQLLLFIEIGGASSL